MVGFFSTDQQMPCFNKISPPPDTRVPPQSADVLLMSETGAVITTGMDSLSVQEKPIRINNKHIIEFLIK